jgi:predicted aspartyl protease
MLKASAPEEPVRLFAVPFLLFPFAVLANPANAQLPALQSTAMLDCSGLPCVDATLASGKHLRLLIDTGNVNSALDITVATEAGLAVTAVNRSDGKPAGYGRSVMTGVKLGEGSLGDVRVLVLGLAEYVKRDRMPAADGTLAYTAFKDRLLQLDYVHHSVRFSEPLTASLPCPSFCGSLTTPTFGKNGPPIIVSTGFSVNGKAVTAQVDTMFTGTMLIYPTSIEKLGLTAESQTTKKQFFKYTDDGVDMLEAQAANESFGERVLAKPAALFFATPTVHLPDGLFDATVGHALFEHYILSLNFHDMSLWLSD